MAWSDALDLEILGGVACKLEHFSSQVFENGCQVDASFGTDARLLSREISEMALYATTGELQTRSNISAWSLCAACETVRGVGVVGR